MPDTIVMPAYVVERLRRKAKKLTKEAGIAHYEALDALAREGGVFPNWHHLIEAAKATEPTERAFKFGIVMGIDAKEADDVPGWRLHQLSTGHWSVWVNGNWRVTFTFEGTDAASVDYVDHH